MDRVFRKWIQGGKTFVAYSCSCINICIKRLTNVNLAWSTSNHRLLHFYIWNIPVRLNCLFLLRLLENNQLWGWNNNLPPNICPSNGLFLTYCPCLVHCHQYMSLYSTHSCNFQDLPKLSHCCGDSSHSFLHFLHLQSTPRSSTRWCELLA